MSETTTQKIVPQKLYRIGEIVRHTGLSRQTIHNYTAMGLIRETERTSGGHRLYEEQVFYSLQKIADMKKSATMQDIRAVFSQGTGSGFRGRHKT